MNIINLYKELSKSTDWNVSLSTEYYLEYTIIITKPDSDYFFLISQDEENLDMIYNSIHGGIYVNDDTHEAIANNYCYECAGKTVEEVAQDIMSDIQTDMIDYDD